MARGETTGGRGEVDPFQDGDSAPEAAGDELGGEGKARDTGSPGAIAAAILAGQQPHARLWNPQGIPAAHRQATLLTQSAGHARLARWETGSTDYTIYAAIDGSLTSGQIRGSVAGAAIRIDAARTRPLTVTGPV